MPVEETPLRLSTAPDTFSDGVVHLRALGHEHAGLLVRASHDPDVQRWTLLALYTKLGNVTSERVAERTGFVATPGTVQAVYQGRELTLRQWLRQAPPRA